MLILSCSRENVLVEAIGTAKGNPFLQGCRSRSFYTYFSGSGKISGPAPTPTPTHSHCHSHSHSRQSHSRHSHSRHCHSRHSPSHSHSHSHSHLCTAFPCNDIIRPHIENAPFFITTSLWYHWDTVAGSIT